MAPILVTVAILSLMGTLLHGANRRAADRELIHRWALTQTRLSREAESSFQDELYARTVIKNRERTPSTTQKKAVSKATGKKQRKRHHLSMMTRLSLEPFLSKGEDSCRELAGRLLRELYGHTDFFPPGIEYRLLDRLREQLQHGGFGLIADPSEPEQLASVPMGDLQKVWLRILQGSDLEEPSYPSLVPFISLRKAGKINVVLAPPSLLRALFLKDAEAIIEARDDALTSFRELLEEDPEADGEPVLKAVREAVELAREAPKIRLSYDLVGDGERLTIKASDPRSGLTKSRSFRLSNQ